MAEVDRSVPKVVKDIGVDKWSRKERISNGKWSIKRDKGRKRRATDNPSPIYGLRHFFGAWESENIGKIIKVLKCFHAVSGLKINLAKCNIF